MSVLVILYLGLAGGLGAVCRYLVDQWVTGLVGRRWSRRLAARRPAQGASPGGPLHAGPDVPVGTIAVNMTACLALGALTGGLAPHAPAAVTVLGTGFLGGYSTFSTACVETARLMLAGRVLAGVAQAAAMAVLCLTAVAAGLTLAA